MTGLTPTAVLRYLNRMLGASLQELELTEDQMMRVVFQESLMTFSKYFPYKFKIPVKRSDSIGGGYSNVYKIPNDDHIEILGVHRVWLDNMNQFGGSLLPLVNDPLQQQLLNDTLSMIITPVTFRYEAPDLITIRPKIERIGTAMIEVKGVHPKHLRTIPIAMRDQFLRLCLDDVLLSLYPLRHRFDSLTTPYGNIQLFLEQLDNAGADRDALLDSWKDSFLKDGTAKRLWIS